MASILSFLTPRRALLLTVVLALAIAAGTLLPAVHAPGGDKLQHLVAFAALAFPIALAQPRWLLVALPAVVLFGGGIELVQPLVGRDAEWLDLMADGTGALIGAGVGVALRAAMLRLA